MSTFVVHMIGKPLKQFRGRIQHVSTGEETVFSSVAELVAFLEGMMAACDLDDLSEIGEAGPASGQADTGNSLS